MKIRSSRLSHVVTFSAVGASPPNTRVRKEGTDSGSISWATVGVTNIQSARYFVTALVRSFIHSYSDGMQIVVPRWSVINISAQLMSKV